MTWRVAQNRAVVALALVVTSGSQAEQPRLEALPDASEFELDGRIDEAEWTGASGWPDTPRPSNTV